MTSINPSWHEPTEMGLVVPCDGIVTNLEYHDQGQYLAVTTNQSAIHFIDSLEGLEKKKLFVKKDGVGKIQFTHHEMSLLVSSKYNSPNSISQNHDIRYLCVYDNRYLRYFKGHTMEVTSLAMNPVSDQFISASQDNTVQIWDLSTQNAVAKITLPYQPKSTYYQPPLCVYDNAGLVFGVLTRTALKLFDARNYGQGPFANIFPSTSEMKDMLQKTNENLTDAQLLRYLTSNWINFEFSADSGNTVLVNTDTEAIFLLDG